MLDSWERCSLQGFNFPGSGPASTGFRVSGLGFRALGFQGFRDLGFQGFRVLGLGFPEAPLKTNTCGCSQGCDSGPALEVATPGLCFRALIFASEI